MTQDHDHLTRPNRANIGELLADGTAIDAAPKRAAADAVRRHKLAGNPIAVWRDGKVAWVRPEDIHVEPE